VCGAATPNIINTPFPLHAIIDRLKTWVAALRHHRRRAAAEKRSSMGGTAMLKHLAIAAGIAALLLVGISVGYLSATSNLNASRSNVYKTATGTSVPYTYTFNISINHDAPTVADKKAILSAACAQAAQDIK
jgi:hypothetical protein